MLDYIGTILIAMTMGVLGAVISTIPVSARALDRRRRRRHVGRYRDCDRCRGKTRCAE